MKVTQSVPYVGPYLFFIRNLGAIKIKIVFEERAKFMFKAKNRDRS